MGRPVGVKCHRSWVSSLSESQTTFIAMGDSGSRLCVAGRNDLIATNCDEADLKTKRRTDGEPKRKEYRMITDCESAQDHQYPRCRRVGNVKSAGE